MISFLFQSNNDNIKLVFIYEVYKPKLSNEDYSNNITKP